MARLDVVQAGHPAASLQRMHDGNALFVADGPAVFSLFRCCSCQCHLAIFGCGLFLQHADIASAAKSIAAEKIALQLMVAPHVSATDFPLGNAMLSTGGAPVVIDVDNSRTTARSASC